MAAVVGLALSHVTASAVVRPCQMVRIETLSVASDAVLADLSSLICRRGVRVVAGPAPEFLAAQLGATAQRQLFNMADDLETALLAPVVGGSDEDRPELF